MTKVFCDVCGKQINASCDKYRLTADRATGIVYRSNEVCGECIEKINDYIARLNPNWHKDGD